MLEILLIRPGCTTFEVEHRIQGSLEIPLHEQGLAQAEQLGQRLAAVKLDFLYVSPCESARQTAEIIAEYNFSKQKVVDCLKNLNLGLWQGRLVSEVKRLQPKVYRQYQESPQDVQPPEGETVQQGMERVRSTLQRLLKRHREGRIGLIVPQPMVSIVRCVLTGGEIKDLWESKLDVASYEVLQLEASDLVPVLSSLPKPKHGLRFPAIAPHFLF